MKARGNRTDQISWRTYEERANHDFLFRLRKMFEHRCTVDEERLKVLESQLKEARNTVEEADKKCDEVSCKHLLIDVNTSNPTLACQESR